MAKCGRCKKEKGDGEGFCQCGRPTVVTEEVIGELEKLFKHAFPVKKACEYAGISTDAYYDALKRDKEFADKMRKAQLYPSLRARWSVIKAAKQNPDIAIKYLERKEKDEFSTRQEHTGADGKPIEQNVNVLGEAKKRAGKYTSDGCSPTKNGSKTSKPSPKTKG